MESVEWIRDGDELVALIVRREYAVEQTEFLTPPECNQQLGLIAYPRDGAVPPHTHLPVERRLVGTTEVFFVRSGAAELDIFSAERELICTRELRQGDVALLLAGGHGLRMKEDTVLLEIKQGPYIQSQDKVAF